MEVGQRIVGNIPPGAILVAGPGVTSYSVPLWVFWWVMARANADLSTRRRGSDAALDYQSALLAGVQAVEPPGEDRDLGPGGELGAAIVAISCAAFAIDGLYGSIKPLVQPAASKAARARKILEGLKLAFHLTGSVTRRWQTDLDWLFDLRDRSVHHAQEFRPAVVIRATELTAEVGPIELLHYSAESAQRAAGLAEEVLDHCLAHPKAAVRPWATSARNAWNAYRSGDTGPA